jgi:hypothetical protein
VNVRLDVLTAVNIMVPHSQSGRGSWFAERGDSSLIWNVGTHLLDYMVSHPRRP